MPGLNGPIPGLNMQLAEYLYDYHVGEFKAVSSRELEVTFQMHGAKIREQINALRTAGVPICSCERLLLCRECRRTEQNDSAAP